MVSDMSTLPAPPAAEVEVASTPHLLKIPNEILSLILHMAEAQDAAYRRRQDGTRLDGEEDEEYDPEEYANEWKKSVILALPAKKWLGRSLIAFASVNLALRELARPLLFRLITPVRASANLDTRKWRDLGREAWLSSGLKFATPHYIFELDCYYKNLNTLLMTHHAVHIFGHAPWNEAVTSSEQSYAYRHLQALAPRILHLKLLSTSTAHTSGIMPAFKRLRSFNFMSIDGDMSWNDVQQLLKTLPKLRSFRLSTQATLGPRAITFTPPLQHLCLHLPVINEAAWACVESVASTLRHLELGGDPDVPFDEDTQEDPVFRAAFPLLRTLHLSHLQADKFGPILDHLGLHPSPLASLTLTILPTATSVALTSPTPSLSRFSTTLRHLHLAVDLHDHSEPYPLPEDFFHTPRYYYLWEESAALLPDLVVTRSGYADPWHRPLVESIEDNDELSRRETLRIVKLEFERTVKDASKVRDMARRVASGDLDGVQELLNETREMRARLLLQRD